MLPGPPGWQPKVPVCKLPLLSIGFALMEPECLSNCCGKSLPSAQSTFTRR